MRALLLEKMTSCYREFKQPVKASFWFLICGFLQKGVSMLTTPIFTRVMTEAEYGEFAAYHSWFSMLQIIVSLNLAAGVYTRGLIKNEDDQDRFSSSMLGLSTTCILVWSGVYALFHDAVNGVISMSTPLMAALLVDIWAHAAFQFWSNRERVNYRYQRLAALTVTYVFLRPAVGVAAVLLAEPQQQMEARVLATVLGNVLLFSGLFFAVFKSGKQFFHKEYWRYALRFNIPLLPHYLSQVVLNQSDRVMIRDICGASDAAYYSVAYTLAAVLQILNTSISATMNPWIYQSIKKNELKKIGDVSYAVLGLIAAANLMLVLTAPELLRVLAPERYQAAVWAIPPVTVSIYFSFLYNLFATFEFYYEKTQYVMLASVLGAGINIVLNLIFIPRYGFVAAGYTTLFCYILYAAAHYCLMRYVNWKNMNGNTAYRPVVLLAVGGALLAASGLAMLFYRLPLVRYGLLLLLVIALLCIRKPLIRILRGMN